VANAIPSLKEMADHVTVGARGAGVEELAQMLLGDDLAALSPRLARHDLPLGHAGDGRVITVPAYGATVLVAGTSGGGKSSIVTGLVERLAERGYQHAIVDPEGDYLSYESAVVLGEAQNSPALREVMDVMAAPGRNVVANLLGIPLDQRPSFCASLLAQIFELRGRLGRPHWIVLDETHHLLPEGWQVPPPVEAGQLKGLVLVTVHPEHVATPVLRAVDLIVALGQAPDMTLRQFAGAVGVPPPAVGPGPLPPGDAYVWSPRTLAAPIRLRATPARGDRRRHARKYAEGELGPERSFYFRGPDGRLNLRAQNLRFFLQVADGVDDDTWLFHLRRGDYSAWMREAIKDDDMADEIAVLEADAQGPADPGETRGRVRAAVEARYTAPA
jgi:hypothetical protein